MAEGSTTKAATMARKLESVHRWCVTGTPIQKSISDLYGLFLFLNLQTYSDKRSFTEHLEKPAKRGDLSPLTRVLVPIFWRTRKSQVVDQVLIPTQQELVHWLKFSPVEENFYQQQHRLCRDEALLRFLKFQSIQPTAKLSNVCPQTVNNLLLPLLKLRQVQL